MYSGYRTIFWGILLISFHIDIGMIRILPAFIACLIVVSGIDKLIEIDRSDSFLKAKAFSIMAAGLLFISGIFTSGIFTLTRVNGAVAIILSIMWPILFGMLELMTEYKILEGSVQYLNDNNKVELAEEYIIKTKNYTIVFIIFTILECISISFFMKGIISIVVIVVGLILRICFMSMMSNLKNLYEEC